MVRKLLTLALLAHGIGHILFVANAWDYWRTEAGGSWFFDQVFQATATTEGLFGLLWLVPLVGFLIGAWSFNIQSSGWQPLLLASAAVSCVLILIWWGGINLSSALFALIFNLSVIAVILWQGERHPLPG